MKKFTLILLLAAILLPACRYEEGPAISFRTVRNWLSAYWMVTDFRINNIDSLTAYKEKCNCIIKKRLSQFICESIFSRAEGELKILDEQSRHENVGGFNTPLLCGGIRSRGLPRGSYP